MLKPDKLTRYQDTFTLLFQKMSNNGFMTFPGSCESETRNWDRPMCIFACNWDRQMYLRMQDSTLLSICAIHVGPYSVYVSMSSSLIQIITNFFSCSHVSSYRVCLLPYIVSLHSLFHLLYVCCYGYNCEELCSPLCPVFPLFKLNKGSQSWFVFQPFHAKVHGRFKLLDCFRIVYL